MKEISVKTTFGELVACVGGDDEFPEILVFLRNEDGKELMLSAVTDQSISGCEDALRIAVYGDTRADDYTGRAIITRADIFDGMAIWQ